MSQMTRLFFCLLLLGAPVGASGARARPQEDPPADRTGQPEQIDDRHRRDHLNREMMRLEREGLLRPIGSLPWTPLAQLPPLPHPTAQPRSGPERYRAVCDATVMVHTGYKCDRCANWHGGVATGFVIHPDGWIITAAHVVTGEHREHSGSIMLHDEKVYPIVAVAAIDEARDVAIIRIEARGLSALPLAGSDPEPGEPIAVVGHPQTHFYTLTEGVVSRLLGEGERPSRRLQITAGFATGSSGAPVVDASGNVVGMALSTRTLYADNEKKENPQLVIRLCVSVEDIRAACEGR